MNFFEAQDKAHRRTGLLVTMLTTGLVAMTVGLYFVVMLSVHLLGGWTEMEARSAAKHGSQFRPDAVERWSVEEMSMWWSPEVLLITFIIMVFLVGGGFLYRYLQLRSGGEAVAEMMGGVRIVPDATDPHQRRALNVVEEMAIASGVPVPPVYELKDESINAFAAGHTVDQAAIGLTRGCMALPRDELQGVVAHEFSHIFNGDMRLNVRLIAVINGVMVLGIAGLLLARYVGWGLLLGGGGRRSSNDKGGGLAIAVALIILGWLVAAIGFMGTLVARIIQAAVSRQREFLADASAVQYTRNPDGIAGALSRIAQRPRETKISGEASQFNHMFFSQAVPALFATHPPLPQRIDRITSGRHMELSEEGMAATSETDSEAHHPVRGMAAAAVAIGQVQQALASAGDVNAVPMEWTRQVINSIPQHLRDAAHSPQSVRALIAAMIINDSPDNQQIASLQDKALSAYLPAAEVQGIKSLQQDLSALHPSARIPLLDMSSAAVLALSSSQAQALQSMINDLVAADQKVSRFEWVVAMIVDAMLSRSGDADHAARRSLQSMASSVAIILEVVGYAGGMDVKTVGLAMSQACQSLKIPMPSGGPTGVSLKQLNLAVGELRQLKFSERGRLLQAVVSIVDHDGQTTVEEAEVVRAVAEVLAVPMPPVVPDEAGHAA